MKPGAPLKSDAYSRTIHSVDPEIKVYQAAAPRIVHLVEESCVN